MNDKSTKDDSEIVKTLGLDKSRKRGKWLKRLLVLILLAVAAAFAWPRLEGDKNGGGGMRFTTRPAEKGDLTVTVTASGTLEPTNQVDVGSELSGIVKSVEADYNDPVKKKQVLAVLDTSKLQAQVLQSRASLESAKAKVLQAEATIEEATRQLERLEQLGKLSGARAVSQYDLDSAKANLARAVADRAAAVASVSQAQASLEVSETDLSKAVIYSPIDGVVLTRSVEPGQTVAASLQAPVLFTIAEDLKQMELHVDVDEADVGKVKEGQRAVFYVDAYPDRAFPAKISQVRYGAETVDGVVTYETVLNADNSDLSLRPGMTATADIVVEEIRDAVLIPNAALRFSPPIPAKSGPSGGGGILGKLFFRPPRGPEKERREKGGDKQSQKVWTLRDGRPASVPVTLGVSNGSMTQVLEGLEPGTELIVDATEAKG